MNARPFNMFPTIMLADNPSTVSSSKPSSLEVELGNQKRLTAGTWQGESRVDIRQWNGKPTKKGVSLTLMRYLSLRDAIPELTQALDKVIDGAGESKLQRHLGRNVYASVGAPFVGVSLRQWFMPKDSQHNAEDEHLKLLPGKGIFLNRSEWLKFCEMDQEMDNHVPELKTTIRCFDRDDHMNQLGWLSCAECNPNSNFYGDY